MSSRSAASFDFALGLGEFFGGSDEFGVAAVVAFRRAQVLAAVRPCRCRGWRLCSIGPACAFGGFESSAPTAALTSAQIASPCVISSALVSAAGSSVVVAAVVSVVSPPPPPQPATPAPQRGEQEQERLAGGLIEGEASRAIRRLCRGSRELRPRDSNPDYLVQSEACCHYTRPQRRLPGYRRAEAQDDRGEVAVGVGERSPRPRRRRRRRASGAPRRGLRSARR